MTNTIRWTGTLTALSSISHGGETRGLATMLRREQVFHPLTGALVPVPIISGNAFRGVLRRIGEDLLRDVLEYDHQLPLAAAHALRSGGALAKTSKEPLSGARLANLRRLVPQIGVFGAAGGGCIIQGCLQVGKVVPHVLETSHLTGVTCVRTAFDAVQIETYSRVDDSTSHSFVATTKSDGLASDTQQMRYRVETFPAGTTFSTWLTLTRPTNLEAAFFADVLESFTQHGTLGGRSAIGHGRISTDLHTPTPPPTFDWRSEVAAHRDEALTALELLS